MKPMFRLRMTGEMAVRIVADALLVNLAVLAALILRFFYLVGFETQFYGQDYTRIFWEFLTIYRNDAWWLTLICLGVFYAIGFYTHNRFYGSRYKVLIIMQAVAASFLLYGFLSYFLRGVLHLPRAAWVMAWLFSTGLLVAARFWAFLWAGIVRAEYRTRATPEEREIRHVLVIGGAGYIGSALLPKLLEKGYRVRLLDLLLYGTEPIQALLNHPYLEVIQADFRQVDKVVDALRDMDAVIHLGAIVGDPACALDEELTIEINLMATRMIAEVAKGSGVNRFIFASTCSVYGASDETLDERSNLNPVSLYARSKIASERVLMQLADHRFAPVILRFGTIYGLSGRTRFDLVANLLTARAVVDGQITIFGGDQWRPFLHVDDAALALLKCLESPLPLVRKQVFNVGSDDQNLTIRQVGELIQRLVPTAQIAERGTDADRRNYRVSFAKIRNTLSFAPQWTMEQGVQQVIESIRSGKVKDYREARYSNVKFLGEEGAARLVRRENGWAYELIKASAPGLASAG